ncbi:glycoside hydrolase family 2 TIM barrel-domain containing protein [Paenarthrobacter nitroguajacolicus]|uniref:glycoside hydrolase family 2 TIM barrel-domain containing protein n=1 Tax=Paenarthrobacter nitroguajacolicus TaxID=211146 RepID=UPI002858E99A|nr:glycoside hydrolase family 2 TIM barrel-domain containing protein [Paenarthrobacter nitroguajacolicus]MDR6639554.1 beta-galactosidase [Paenarthrobacter nitroguajacolicus]
MARKPFNEGWSVRTRVSAFAELGGASEQWVDVVLPHDALISKSRSSDAPAGAAGAYFPSGAFEYRRKLDVYGADRGKVFILEFDGVYRDAMVYVNGALAGQDAYGYSRFTVRIDPYLRFGTANEVRVVCRAHRDSRWYTGAGIYRDVHLIVKEPIHIGVDGVRVTTADIDSERAMVEVTATITNTTAVTTTVNLATSVNEEGIAEDASDESPVTLLPGTSAVVRHRLMVEDPALWGLDSPSLYTCFLQLRDAGKVIDREAVTFGIRRIQVDARRGLRLNGETVKLRGACVHHDNGPLGAASIAAAEERRVLVLKEAGFNAIRSSHNPASSALLDACDRLGMLVIDEAFDVWTSGKSDYDYATDFAQWWERDLEALVAKDINHPSVIMYSIGNEIPETGTPDGGVWSRRLAEKLRSLDATRPITNGINGFVSSLDLVLAGMKQHQGATADTGAGVNGMMTQVGDMMNQISASEMVSERTAESFSVLDVAGMNYGDGRYLLDKALFPNRVIAGTETFPGQIAKNWDLVKTNNHVIGDFAWTGWDYLGEAGLGSVGYADGDTSAAATVAKPYPWLTAWTGDIDITGERRPASYYREIVFGLRSTPYIAVHRPQFHGRTPLMTPWSWSDAISSWTWEGFEGEPIQLEVYSDSDDVELLLNGVPVGRSTVGEKLAFRADFEIIYTPGDLTAVAYKDGHEHSRVQLSTARDQLHLDVTSDVDLLTADTGDLAFVRIALTDENGIVHNGRDRKVAVTVDGPATLQGLGSANPATDEPFTADSHTTFDGRALAIIRPTGQGPVTVTVTASGCEPATVTIGANATKETGERHLVS